MHRADPALLNLVLYPAKLVLISFNRISRIPVHQLHLHLIKLYEFLYE
jgi:hypothetical protein